ncbi:MAG: TPM domain-containing protein [Pseudomonadales bacterium]
MALVTQQEQQRIAEAIAQVEQHTDAELVTVLAARSDDYRYIPVLWAALAALLLPSLLLLTHLAADLIVATQLAAFCVLALLFRHPAVQHRLIPRRVRHWRAANMARRQFLELGLHHTDGDTGVLMFVSEAERYVEILTDRGISAVIPAEHWSAIVEGLVTALKAGETLRGFESAIAQAGELLAAAVPKTEGNANELDDRLVLIGYP